MKQATNQTKCVEPVTPSELLKAEIIAKISLLSDAECGEVLARLRERGIFVE